MPALRVTSSQLTAVIGCPRPFYVDVVREGANVLVTVPAVSYC